MRVIDEMFCDTSYDYVWWRNNDYIYIVLLIVAYILL